MRGFGRSSLILNLPNPLTPTLSPPGRGSPSALARSVPAERGVGHGIGRGEIGFENEERRAVDAIEPNDIKLVALDARKPRHRSRDRIGPHRRAQRKVAALLGV